MDEYVKTCLQDVYDAILEIDSYFEGIPLRFDTFEKDALRRSAVERKVEIMGEAINRIMKHDSSFSLPEGKEVVKTRNRVIHSYDNVTADFLWSLIIKYIPILKVHVNDLLNK